MIKEGAMLMSEMATWQNDVQKSYYFVKGFAFANSFHNMQKALVLAKKMHDGQYRRGGAEYLVHPLRVCCYLISLGFKDDILLSAALLHDVIEDVEYIRNDPKKIVKEFGISQEVLDLILLVTKTKEVSEESYYTHIRGSINALLIKLSDRCNNVSTLQCFTREKMQKYIDETQMYILPLCSYGKATYPEYCGIITTMKYQITALCTTVQAFLDIQVNNT